MALVFEGFRNRERYTLSDSGLPVDRKECDVTRWVGCVANLLAPEADRIARGSGKRNRWSMSFDGVNV
jgi:hypothetical protein